MKLLKLFLVAMTMMALTTACDVKIDGLNGKDDVGRLWPAYSTDGLSGKIFGSDWKAVAAFARPIPSDQNNLSLELYAEPVATVCQNNFFLTKPYATVVIPKAYAVREYIRDVSRSPDGNGSALTFISTGAVKRDLTADKTKLSIQSITEAGFEAALYSQGTDNGEISEINGHVSVVDCAKVADFGVWDELVGDYRLSSFDGQNQDGRNSHIEFDRNNVYYDKVSKQYLKTLVFPLYKAVSPGRTESFTFGPMKGLGFSKLTTEGTVKTLAYSYHGPLTYEGTEITLNLEMKIVKSEGRLEVTYTLDIPGQFPVTSHQFILLK